MADQKISQLSDGGASQATDEYVIARSGSNFRIDGASIAAAATSVGTLTSLTVSGTTTTGAETIRPVDTSYIRISGGSSAGTGANIIVFGESHSTVPGQMSLSARGSGSMVSTVRTGSFQWFTGAVSTEKMRLDTSGNLGLGVTPQTGWGANRTTFQVHATTQPNVLFTGNPTNGGAIWTNGYYDGTNNKYIANGAASLFSTGNGGFQWFNAPSGTAGNTFTLTQAMTLNASGNLLVGTTTTSSIAAAGRGLIEVNGSSDSSFALKANDTLYGYLYSSATSFRVANATANPLTFFTNNTERARITSGGYFKASNDGTYANSTGSFHEFRNTTNAASLYITSANAAFTSSMIYGDTVTAAGTGFNLVKLQANAVDQFIVRGDGTIFAQNTTVQAISDARLKENIASYSGGWNIIKALRVRTFDWKEGFGNNRKCEVGFIAQEVEPIKPSAVSSWEMDTPTGEVDEDGKPITEKVDYKTVGPGTFLPDVIDALQEAQARIEALEVEVATLKAGA